MDKVERIREKLRGVIDPETGINVVDMGMIERITVRGERAKILFRPTTPGCPLIAYLVKQVKSAAESVVKNADVEVLT
ncbi:MAG: iron-sulfur cluster assembly protein [Hadesarchaea archaeon]|nr:iron-sulfur cluster assembly protein [Hadesarchaea archaeon]